jgi:hypothetical protein
VSPCTVTIIVVNLVGCEVEWYCVVVIFDFTNFMVYMNNCVNFLLYCVSGSKFRKVLYSFLPCKCKQRFSRPNRTVGVLEIARIH